MEYKANDMINKGQELIDMKQEERGLKLILSVPEMFPKAKARFKAFRQIAVAAVLNIDGVIRKGILQVEGEPRDAYTGSMGYLGRDGSLDLNILIRTLTVEGEKICFRTGAGIVADSEPQAELAETRAKAQGLLRALGEGS